jgi:hypothetical protein
MKHGVRNAADGFYNPLEAMRIILKWIFKKWDGGHGLDWSGLG